MWTLRADFLCSMFHWESATWAYELPKLLSWLQSASLARTGFRSSNGAMSKWILVRHGLVYIARPWQHGKE